MVLISKKAVSSNRLVLYGGRWRCPPGAAFQQENLRLIYIFKFFGYGQGGHGGAKTGAYYYHIGLNIADFCKTTWNTMLPNDIGYYPEFFNVNTSTNRSLLSILKRPLSSM